MRAYQINWKYTGFIFALAMHAIVYSNFVRPMPTANDVDGMGYLAISSLIYFPASILAWGAAFAFRSTVAYTNTLLFAGGLWYGSLGFFFGRIADKKLLRGK